MANGAVVTAACPLFLERFRQLKFCGDLIASQAFVGHTQGLVVDVAVHIALAFHQLDDILVTPGRPVVLRNNHFRVRAPALNGGVNVLRPGQRVADFRAAQGVGVVQSMGHVLCGLDHFLLFDVPQHLRRSF